MGKALSFNLPEDKGQFIQYEDIEGSKVVYQSLEKSKSEFLRKQTFECWEDRDGISEYIKVLTSFGPEVDPSNLYLPLQCRLRSQGLCEQRQFVEIYYTAYDYWLQTQIGARRSRGESFSESEIWYLTLSVLNGVRQFEKIHWATVPLTVDCVKLNGEGHVKIVNVLSSPKDYESSSKSNKYWSNRNLINFYVEQTYRIGILILQLCSCLWSDSTYGNPGYEEINQALHNMRKRYSDLLFILVTVMLSHPKDRPLPSQIYQVFAPFRTEILQFRPFQFSVNLMTTSINKSKYTYPSSSRHYQNSSF